MKKANIVLDDQSTGLTIIEKMEFDDVDVVFDVLHDVFHPSGVKDDEGPDARFLALWNIFLISVGWTDDEYWEVWRSQPRTCRDCGELMTINGDHHIATDSSNKDEDKPN